MTRRSRHKPPVALDSKSLEALALFYVGRYATTRAKLRAYLTRKVRERGWEDAADPPITDIASRFAELGYIDDAAFARSKSEALAARGYGRYRLEQALHAAGIEDQDAREARHIARDSAWDSALAFARKRRIGPFSEQNYSPEARKKALAAMARAGHPFDIARLFVYSSPGEMPERPD